VGCGPAQSPPRCNKCNSPPINNQTSYYSVWHYNYLCTRKVKVKVIIYIAPSRETSKALRHGLHGFTCKLHRACLYLVSVHQMAPLLTCSNVRLISAYYSSIDLERMKG